MTKTKNRASFWKKVNISHVLISVQFGLIIAWLINDFLTPIIFSTAFIEVSLYRKFGIILFYTPFISCAIYVLLSIFEKIYLHFKERKRMSFWKKIQLLINKLVSRKWVFTLIFIGLSLLLSFHIFGENLRAQWWIIDDHEIINYLGPDGELSIKEIPRKLIVDTEIGNFGGKPRYRPIYYILRLLEAALWGNRPELFYLFRILICAFFIFVCWYILKDSIGLISSFIFTMALMSFNYWADIFSRLGPSESYAVLGLSLFCLGYKRYKQSNHQINSLITWILIFCGTVISIGSKENMAFLILVVFWMFFVAAIRKQLTKSQIVFSALSTAFTTFVVLAILFGIINHGNQDMYSTDISISSLLTILKNELRTLPFSIIKYFSNTILMIAISFLIVISGLTIEILVSKNLSEKTRVEVRNIIAKSAFWLLAVYSLFLSQRIFYVQRWPTEIRYDFPGRIGSMATLIILINTCLLLFRRAQTRKLDLVLFRSGYVILFLIILIQNNRFYSLREYSRENVRRTTIFTQHIETIAKTAHNYPDYPIIFESFDVMDYEPIFSVKYFLTAFGVSNDISINLNGYSNQSFDVGTSGKRLAERLEEISTEGAIEGFVPLVNINDLNGKCFNIDFSGVSSTGCQNLGKIW